MEEYHTAVVSHDVSYIKQLIYTIFGAGLAVLLRFVLKYRQQTIDVKKVDKEADRSDAAAFRESLMKRIDTLEDIVRRYEEKITEITEENVKLKVKVVGLEEREKINEQRIKELTKKLTKND